MDILLRKAEQQDAESIALLSLQLGYSISTELIIENLKAINSHSEHDAFVAVHNSRIIGWVNISCMIQIESTPYGEIRGLVVAEDLRGRGVGKMLVAKCIQWCREKGLSTLRLRTNIKRTQAHEFYKHLGFTETKQQKVFVLNLG